LTLNSCQISGNQSATKGGGVYSDSLARLVIINSIISGNLARDGGGIYSRSSIVEIINSTFSGNSATENGGGYYVYGGTLDIGNTILALNNSGNDGADVYKKGNGNVVICNFNLVGDATGLETVISEGTITNLDPLFQQEVPTAPSIEGNLSLQKCSPAVNSGNNILPPLGLSKDIAGNARKVDAFIDLGAFEYQTVGPHIVTRNLFTTICYGDGLFFNNKILTESGTFKDTVTTKYGCDTIITLNLSVLAPKTGIVKYSGCSGDGYVYMINGTTYDELNPTGTEMMLTENGCDSIITVNLTFHERSIHQLNYEGCSEDGFSQVVNGTTYDINNPSGIENMTSTQGCDSVVTIDFLFHTSSTEPLNYTGCSGDGYSKMINGTTYDEANPTGTEIFSNAVGCDSVVTIDLRFNALSLDNELDIFGNHETICEGSSFKLFTNMMGPDIAYRWTIMGDTTFSRMTTGPIFTIEAADASLHTANYQVEVLTNECASLPSAPIQIQVQAKPYSPVVSIPTTVCMGDSLKLTAAKVKNAEYFWSGPMDFETKEQAPLIKKASALHAGIYQVAIAVNGCLSDPVATQVDVKALPTAPLAAYNGPICEGETLRIFIENKANNATYTWYDNDEKVLGTGDSLVFSNALPELSKTYYASVEQNGCVYASGDDPEAPDAAFVNALVAKRESVAAYAGIDVTVCADDFFLTATEIPDSLSLTGQWRAIDNDFIWITDPNESSTPVGNLANGVNHFIWEIGNASCGVLAADSVAITYVGTPVLTADFAETPFNRMVDIAILENDILDNSGWRIDSVSVPMGGETSITSNNTITYFPYRHFAGKDWFTYTVCSIICPDKCATATINVNVITDENCMAPNLITPNSDGLNDSFIVPCTGLYPGSELIVFNRWGQEVYRNQDYRNDWYGTYKERPLPVGTYFYQLLLNNEDRTKLQGHVYVQRE